jgi:hypothetical protein
VLPNTNNHGTIKPLIKCRARPIDGLPNTQGHSFFRIGLKRNGNCKKKPKVGKHKMNTKLAEMDVPTDVNPTNKHKF